MPRKEINYQNTIIYKIVCNNLNVKDVYVGHTTDFTKRKAKHKYDCVNSKSKSYNYKIFKIMRENESWNNWSMIEVEKYPCNDKNEACLKERYWYELLNANMNTFCPTFDIIKNIVITKKNILKNIIKNIMKQIKKILLKKFMNMHQHIKKIYQRETKIIEKFIKNKSKLEDLKYVFVKFAIENIHIITNQDMKNLNFI